MSRKKFLNLKTVQKIIFARQLALMLRSGISIIDSLSFIKKQTKNKTFKYILDSIVTDLEKGSSLANALKKFQKVFGLLFISVVEVGELSGNLDKNLEYLAKELKKQNDLKKKLVSVFIYPVFILVATLGVASLMIFVIFPRILPLFIDLKIRLPLLTRIFINLSNFLLSYWPFILGSLIVFVFLIYISTKIRQTKYFLDLLIYKIPLVSSIIRYSVLANISRNLALLLNSGLDIVKSIEIVSFGTKNLIYKKILENLIVSVKAGHSLKEFFRQEAHYFDDVFLNLLEVGEKTGSLNNNLLYLSEYYEETLDEKLKNFVTILEPLLLALMGVIVAFMGLAIVTPIYQITQEIQFKQ